MFAAYKHRCSVLVKADPRYFEQSCDQLENNSIPTFRYRVRHSHCELAAVKWANKNKQSPCFALTQLATRGCTPQNALPCLLPLQHIFDTSGCGLMCRTFLPPLEICSGVLLISSHKNVSMVKWKLRICEQHVLLFHVLPWLFLSFARPSLPFWTRCINCYSPWSKSHFNFSFPVGWL